jgi:hypothetical protein
MQQFETAGIRVFHLTDAVKANALRHLDEREEEGSHKILLATDTRVLRGVDLRSPNKGICLLLTEAFETQRDAEQAMTRVGLYHEKCERLILSSFKLVDETRNKEWIAKLIKFRC